MINQGLQRALRLFFLCTAYLLSLGLSAQLTQQGSKLVGTGNIGNAKQGTSSALSADGNTLIVGAPADNDGGGAAWIFTRSGGTWTEQQKLVGTGNVGNAQQGISVALSDDGNTAIVGGYSDNDRVGAAWVFTRSGSTWSQQRKLVGTGNTGSSLQGSSVALSYDGNTALVGGVIDNNGVGAAWIFTRSGSTWSQQRKLVGTGNVGDSRQGASVALSDDGNTAIVGGYGDNDFFGAAWVFTRSGSTWTQQQKLVGTDAIPLFGFFVQQGVSIALSSDGNTAIMGGYEDNESLGAAWVFTRSGGTWTQQQKLVGTDNDGSSEQGRSVALAGDGNTAIVGGYRDNGFLGAAWLFTRSGGTWTQQQKLIGTGNTGSPGQGSAVSLSSNGTTATVSGIFDNNEMGATWVFAPAAPCTPSVAIASNDTDNSITTGTEVTFTATPANGGTAPGYVWKKNNATILNETGATYTTTTLANGDKIKVEMTSNDACASPTTATSNEIAMTVTAACPNPPTASISYAGSPFCGSAANALPTITGTTGGIFSYTDVTVDIDIDGSTGAIYSKVPATYHIKYTIPAANGCPEVVANTTVSIISLPTAYTVTGGGAYCAGGTGVVVGLFGSQSGISYQLKKDNVNLGSPVAGTGEAISFGNQMAAGNYTVEASRPVEEILTGIINTPTRCIQTMTGSVFVTIIPLPTAYNVTGGGAYCTGGTGAAVGLCNSESGVSYQLKKDDVNLGSPVTGTGAAISFGNQSATGSYTVEASRPLKDAPTNSAGNAPAQCIQAMTGSVFVTVIPLPTAYIVTGGGAYCAGGTGVVVGLSNSESGVSYQLKKDNVNLGNPVAGTGAAINFGNQMAAGNYTVEAIKNITSPARLAAGADAPAPCIQTMTGSAFVSIIPLPTAYNVTGGGAYCAGGTGVAVGLSNSESGVSYQLKKDNVNLGTAVNGTGSAISFGNQTAAGSYTVEASRLLKDAPANSAGNAPAQCIQTMTGNATVSIIPLPTAYIVTGGGAYCASGTGVVVGLSNSESGVSYQLKKDNVNLGTAVNGTGSAISFGNQTAASSYTVEASRLLKDAPANSAGNAPAQCIQTMTGNATVSIIPLPTAYIVTGGGAYCAGGTGVAVSLANSESGVSYQLKKDNVNLGSAVAGTGAAISFGNQPAAGSYTVEASRPLKDAPTNTVGNAAAQCTQTMTGSVFVSIIPLPTAYTVTGGGSFCAGGSGVVVGLSNSESGVSYQLKKDNVNLGNPVAGTGAAISFGNQSAAGSYTVEASRLLKDAPTNSVGNAPAPCIQTMTGSAIITVNPLPVAKITGSAQVCKDAPAPTITFTGSAGKAPYTFTYTLNTGGKQTLTTTDGSSVSINAPTASGGIFSYVLVSVSDANSCTQTQTGNATVTVLAPTMPTNPKGDTLYAGQATTLTAKGCSGEGFTLMWFNAADNSPATMPVSPAKTATYYAKCQQVLGSTTCLSAPSATVTVTVAQRIFVNAANTNSTQNGTAWATAFASLQAGLSAAKASSYTPLEVWVAQGIYKPGTLRRDVFTIPSGVKVYGGFVGNEDQLSPRDWKNHKTILSGEIGTAQRSDNAYHVVFFSATNDQTRLDGFHIEKAFGDFFTGNQAADLNDPDIQQSGGGILTADKSKGTVTNCVISDNKATFGGGILLRDSSHLVISKTIIWGNEATFGGGIYVLGGSKPRFENVLIVSNKGLGGGLYVNASQPTLIHCTIASNLGTNGTAGGIYNTNAATTLKNAIVWGNSAPQSTIGSLITYSIIEGGFAGTGNRNQNPRFVSASPSNLAVLTALGDYHLLSCSPAIDAANNADALPIDLDGNPRPFLSAVGIVDMGAYESSVQAGNGPANLTVTEPITSGTVLKTAGRITAVNQVSGATVVYQGSQSVTLLPGFVATGNTFQAIIGDCGTAAVAGSETQK